MKRTIVLVSIALVILIGVQLYWIQNAYTLKQNQLREDVKQVLGKTARMAVDESTCFELFGKAFIKPHQGIYFARQNWAANGAFVNPAQNPPDSVRMFFNASGDTNVYYFNNIKFMDPLTAEFVIKCRYYLGDTLQPDFQKGSLQNIEKISYKKFNTRLKESSPITKRLNMHYMDSSLHALMAQARLGAPFYYGLVRTDNDSVEYMSKGADPGKLKASKMYAALPDEKYFSHTYRLALCYVSGNKLALAALWGILLTSAVVILLLCYGFWYFINTILAQKKLSEMKTDFINNMTHEFKTPITNISLAVENICDKPGQGSNTALLNIIAEENNRLRDNVERILQVATLDKEEIVLQIDKIDVNSLIEKIAANMELSRYPNEPDIQYSLKAENPYIMADETHIINIIYNLLDNAIKYCDGKPVVRISTCNVPKGVAVTVEDNGIGMDAETRKRVFEKFYRAHTGNIHKVKGFGLGLSYVKDLVKLHNGTIKLDSEPGKGSRFEIFFPFVHAEQTTTK